MYAFKSKCKLTCIVASMFKQSQKDNDIDICAGLQYMYVNISGCSIDPYAPVGTVMEILFFVTNNNIPSLNSTVVRTIVISSPCSSGEYLCGPADCSAIPCSTRYDTQSWNST